MTATVTHPMTPSRDGPKGWFRRAEAWLDDKGKWAWIATMFLGFVVFWPVGLALLAYLIWSKRMFSSSCPSARTPHALPHSSGNAAFDSYKTDMLRRLEDEQRAFEGFLQRLRDAKDKAEFDQFMDDRSKTAGPDNDAQTA